MRNNKTDINGVYVSVDNPEISFEINKDYAFLHKNFEEMFSSTYTLRILEIRAEKDNVIWLEFSFQDEKDLETAYVVDFYSDKNGDFVWLDYMAQPKDKKHVFKKLDCK